MAIFSFLSNWFTKASKVGSQISQFSLGRPVFPTRDYANFAKEAYQLNIIAYRCIHLISTSAASVPWLIYRDDKEVTKSNSVLDVLKHPNPMQTGKELFTSIYAFDLLAGNSYTERVLVRGNKLQEMHVLRPDRIKIVPGSFGLPQSYVHTVNSNEKSFDVDPVTGESDLLHVKTFNPLNDWYGQSPLEALGMSVDSHNEATKWNFALLQNGARPSGALEYGDADMDDENFNRLKGEISENYSGSKRGRPMLLQGGLKWVQMMLTSMEMDWAKGKEVSAREVAIGYNVPEQLVGVPGQQTYNNYKEARMAFYEDAVLPLLDRYSEALTNWLQDIPEFEGLRISYDVDAIQALAPRREGMWDKVAKAGAFLTVDEQREALGYEPYDPPPNATPGQLLNPLIITQSGQDKINQDTVNIDQQDKQKANLKKEFDDLKREIKKNPINVNVYPADVNVDVAPAAVHVDAPVHIEEGAVKVGVNVEPEGNSVTLYEKDTDTGEIKSSKKTYLRP